MFKGLFAFIFDVLCLFFHEMVFSISRNTLYGSLSGLSMLSLSGLSMLSHWAVYFFATSTLF